MYMFSLWIVVLKTAHKQTENENDDLVLVRSGNIKDQAPGSLRAAERQRADRARVHHAPATANGKSAKAPSALWVGLKRVRLRRCSFVYRPENRQAHDAVFSRQNAKDLFLPV